MARDTGTVRGGGPGAVATTVTSAAVMVAAVTVEGAAASCWPVGAEPSRALVEACPATGDVVPVRASPEPCQSRCRVLAFWAACWG